MLERSETDPASAIVSHLAERLYTLCSFERIGELVKIHLFARVVVVSVALDFVVECWLIIDEDDERSPAAVVEGEEFLSMFGRTLNT